MKEEKIIKIRFDQMNSSYLQFLDSGGILHITNFSGGLDFLEAHRQQCIKSGELKMRNGKKFLLIEI